VRIMRVHRLLSVAIVLFLIIPILTGCEAFFAPVSDSVAPLEADSPARPMVRIAACFSAEGLAQDLMRVYRGNHPKVGLSLEVMSSRQAIALVKAGACDLALVVGDEGQARAGGVDADQFDVRLVAVDALAVIVHPLRCLQGLSLGDLEQLYSGYTLDWAELNESPGQPTLICREAGALLREALQEAILSGQSVTSAARVAPDDRGAKEIVSMDPLALAVIPATLLDASVCAVPLDGVAPTAAAFKRGTYALGYELLSVTSTDPSEETQALADLLFSATGQQLVEAHYGAEQTP